MQNRKGGFLYGDFMDSKIRKDSWCYQCVGCEKLKDKNFAGKINCDIYRAADKRVWCGDEAIKKFNSTGVVRR